MILHPTEWHAYVDALIERGHMEKRLGVHHRYGTLSSVYGTDVRRWPAKMVEELAYAEECVRTTEAALLQAQG